MSENIQTENPPSPRVPQAGDSLHGIVRHNLSGHPKTNALLVKILREQGVLHQNNAPEPWVNLCRYVEDHAEYWKLQTQVWEERAAEHAAENERLREICGKVMESIRNFPCGHKPNFASGPCEACAALEEWDILSNVTSDLSTAHNQPASGVTPPAARRMPNQGNRTQAVD